MQTFNHEKLALLRELKDWSLLELTIQLHDAGVDLTPSAIVKWEQGENAPNAEYLPALAKVFGIRIEQLFTKQE